MASLSVRDLHQPVQERQPHRGGWDRLQDPRVPARQARQGWGVRAHEAAPGRGRGRDRPDLPGRREVPPGQHREPQDAVPVRGRDRRALHGLAVLRPAGDPRAGGGRAPALAEAQRRRGGAVHRRLSQRRPAAQRREPPGHRDRSRPASSPPRWASRRTAPSASWKLRNEQPVNSKLAFGSGLDFGAAPASTTSDARRSSPSTSTTSPASRWTPPCAATPRRSPARSPTA